MSEAYTRGSKSAVEVLVGMRKRASNPEEVWPAVGNVVADAVGRQFDTQGRYLTGRPWSPLSPDYMEWKVASGLRPRILVATGEMMRKATQRPMPIERYEGKRAVFGITDEPAIFHQFGTEKMPARPILKAAAVLSRRISDVLAEYIVEGRVETDG